MAHFMKHTIKIFSISTSCWPVSNHILVSRVFLCSGVCLVSVTFSVAGTDSSYLIFIVSIDMWQSRVEIEHYSIAYFARIAAFEAL